MTNKNKYLLDTERLRKLEPIMEACGVDASTYLKSHIVKPNGIEEESIKYNIPLQLNLDPGSVLHTRYKTYDHADLESVLPDWCILFNLMSPDSVQRACPDLPGDIVTAVYSLLQNFKHRRGQAKLNAMTDLAILLHENGIKLRSRQEASPLASDSEATTDVKKVER